MPIYNLILLTKLNTMLSINLLRSFLDLLGSLSNSRCHVDCYDFSLPMGLKCTPWHVVFKFIWSFENEENTLRKYRIRTQGMSSYDLILALDREDRYCCLL